MGKRGCFLSHLKLIMLMTVEPDDHHHDPDDDPLMISPFAFSTQNYFVAPFCGFLNCVSIMILHLLWRIGASIKTWFIPLLILIRIDGSRRVDPAGYSSCWTDISWVIVVFIRKPLNKEDGLTCQEKPRDAGITWRRQERNNNKKWWFADSNSKVKFFDLQHLNE